MKGIVKVLLNSNAFQINHVSTIKLKPSPQAIFTWAFVQLPRLSDVPLTQANTLTNSWPDPVIITTGKDGVEENPPKGKNRETKSSEVGKAT